MANNVGFRILIDVNQLELAEAKRAIELAADGVWAITHNSRDIPQDSWPTALAQLNANMWAVSEDDPEQSFEVNAVQQYIGRPVDGAMCYFEGRPYDMSVLTNYEIKVFAQTHGNKIVVHSRSYGRNDCRRGFVDQALGNGNCSGVAFEMNPDKEPGIMWLQDFNDGIGHCLDLDKHCYLLLAPRPKIANSRYPEDIKSAMGYFVQSGELYNPNLFIVLAVYNRDCDNNPGCSGIGYFEPAGNNAFEALKWLKSYRDDYISKLPYQKRIFEAGTTFLPESDGVWLMAKYDKDSIPDLVFIKTSNTATKRVEVHVASGASNYKTRILETGTTFLPESDGVWLMTDYDRDGIPDLVFIKTSNTASGTVEVHIASGASNYQKRIFEAGTVFLPGGDGVWLMADYDRDGIPDLVFIKTSNTASGTVEVQIASGISNYQERILETSTTFLSRSDGVWLMADYDKDGIPDLIFIKTSNTATGTVEVQIASGASKYQTRILGTHTTFLPESDGVWLMVDYNQDGVPDLVFIKTSNTATKRVEVHIAI